METKYGLQNNANRLAIIQHMTAVKVLSGYIFVFSAKAGDKHVPPFVGSMGVRYSVAFSIRKRLNMNVCLPTRVVTWAVIYLEDAPKARYC